MRQLRIAILQPRRIEADPAAREQEYLGLLERAGQAGAGLALLPEDLLCRLAEGGLASDETAQPVPGPFSGRLAEQAARHRMWVAACHYERDGSLIWNCAYLLDRDGRLAGKYRKVHEAELYRVEHGVQVGDDYPVFQTDFGRVGMMICFDNVFPETSRILALRGAELILFPDANYHPSELDIETVTRARAIDNGVYIARASYAVEVYTPGQWVGRGCLIGPDGLIRADAGRAPGLVVSDLDLDEERRVIGYGTWGVNRVRERVRIERRPETYGPICER